MASQWDITMRHTAPAHWWRMDVDPQDRVLDIFGGYHLTRRGVVNGDDLSWQRVGLVKADHNPGMLVKGTYFTAGTNGGVPTVARAVPISIGFWYQLNALPDTPKPFIQSDDIGAQSGWDVLVDTSGKIEIVIGDGTYPPQTVITPQAPALGVPHFVAIVLDATSARVYVDGVLSIEQTGIPVLARGTGFMEIFPFTLGADGRGPYSNESNLDLVLDEVALWPRKLSEEEVISLALAGQEEPDHVARMQMLPQHITEDPNVIGVMEAMGWEHLRYDNAWQDIFEQLFVQTATWGLRYWEQSLQLPVEPVGQSIEQRRTVIMTAVQAKDAVSGADFNAALSAVSTSYRIQMDWATSTVNVSINYNPNDYAEAQLETILAALTPAHLSYNIQYEAFIAGVSTAGDLI